MEKHVKHGWRGHDQTLARFWQLSPAPSVGLRSLVVYEPGRFLCWLRTSKRHQIGRRQLMIRSKKTVSVNQHPAPASSVHIALALLGLLGFKSQSLLLSSDAPEPSKE